MSASPSWSIVCFQAFNLRWANSPRHRDSARELFRTTGKILIEAVSIRNKGGGLNHNASMISVRERELLVRRARTGDPEALNILFESCRKSLYCQALRIVTRPQDAEDAVQEAMLAAFTHLRRFQGRADFQTWATRIVINAALMHIRKARAKPTVSWDLTDRNSEGAPLDERIKDPRPTPEERFQDVERRAILDDALYKLPAQSRQAIQLCKLADHSLKDAAGMLGLSLSSLKARLHRSRRTLMINVNRRMRVRPNARL